MKKLIVLIAVLALLGTTTVFANGGGEGNNTGCNGQGNENSPCAGTTNNGGNGGNVGNITIKNKVKVNSKSNASVRNNVSNQNSANNEGVNVSTNVQGNDVTTIIPPATTPMVGTNSLQVTTPFGGAGVSRDAQYMILNFKLEKLRWAEQEGYIDAEQRLKMGKKLFKKFIKANNNNPLK